MAVARENFRTLAGKMAEFTFALRYDSIPSKIKATARRHLADTIACAIGADKTAILLALKEHAIDKGGGAEATILGTAEKVPVRLAALVNGIMVRYLDANDISFTMEASVLRCDAMYIAVMFTSTDEEATAALARLLDFLESSR